MTGCVFEVAPGLAAVPEGALVSDDVSVVLCVAVGEPVALPVPVDETVAQADKVTELHAELEVEPVVEDV